MELRVKRLSPTAILPAYQTAGAAGLDLHADFGAHEERWLSRNSNWTMIPTGIAVEIPEGHLGLVTGRSGLAAKAGIEYYVGTIDADYRGQVCVLAKTSEFSWPISHGDRIAQLLVVPVARCAVVEVDELSETDRGERGFGSTGR